jgi:hypothetical protein
MDRLTDRDDLNQAVVHPQYCGDGISWEDYIGLLIDRLAAYEETGLTPEDLKEGQDALGKTPMSRFHDIMQAEQEGRVVVLPCKVGDTAYWASNFGKAVNHGKITAVKISGFGVDLEMVTSKDLPFKREAERVFLTREEAETALKELNTRDK